MAEKRSLDVRLESLWVRGYGALVSVVVASPLSAHDSNSHWEGAVAFGFNRCVYGIDDQNHGGPILSRSVQHAVVGSPSEGWLVGSRRPATSHCHCP